MIRLIIFSIIKTRPDIIFAISLVSRFAKNQSHQYTKAVITIFKYLKCLKSQEINYSRKEELKIEAIQTWIMLMIKKVQDLYLNLFLY